MSSPTEDKHLPADEAGRLYVVATPIGNLDDLSPRVQRALGAADLILAEDTRRTRGLLSHLGLNKRLASLHQHNETQRTEEVLDRLGQGQTIVSVSDAGTPAVSDPGAHLVAAALEAGFCVSPLPGPSALTAALSVAGFSASSTDVLFLGFLPRKGGERTRVLERISGQSGLVVFFEASNRLSATLTDLAAREPERSATVCRELTKVYEEVVRGPLSKLLTWADEGVKGELTVVLGPSPRVPVDHDVAAIDDALRQCVAAGLSKRDAATAVATLMSQPRRQVYARLSSIEEESG